MSRIREEVEAMPWPDVLEEGQPSAAEMAIVCIRDLEREYGQLLGRCERLEGRVEFWKRQAAAWRRLAVAAGVGILIVGAWKLLS